MTLNLLGRAVACAVLFGIALPGAATPDEEIAKEDRILALERKVEVLTSELERTQSDLAVPETQELESFYGLGPAASKVYSLSRGLSVGGYAEALYTAIVDDKRESGAENRADFTRGVLYVGYKFTDRILYNMEIEFEHATTEETVTSEGGAASLEFASVDFLGTDWLNARVGLLLVPMGFVNEMHEPPFYYGTHRPDPERRIIPSTWRENGAGLFGTIAEQIDYKLYVVNGMNAQGFDASGLRGGRQKGSEALAEHLAFVGRVDFTPIPELTIGGSVYVGNSGQDQRVTVRDGDGTVLGNVRIPDALTTIWEVHGDLRKGPWHARGLFTMAHVDDAGDLSRALGPKTAGGTGELDAGEGIAERMLGAYAEVGYEVLHCLWPDTEMTLEPFFRWEFVDSQHDMPAGFVNDRSERVNTYTAGLHFQPIRNVVIKLDYRNRRPDSGALGDEVNAGIGLVF